MLSSSPINIVHTPPKKITSANSPLTAVTAAQSLFTPKLTPKTSIESPYSSQKRLGDRKFNKTVHTHNDSVIMIERSEQIEQAIRKIDEKIVSNHNYIENRLESLEEGIKRVDEAIHAEVLNREMLEEKTVKEINLVEANIDIEVQNEREHARDGELRILKKLEGQIQVTREECCRNQHQIGSFMEENTQAISENVERLALDIQEEVAVREKTHSDIIDTIGNGLSRIQQNIEIERKMRHETEAFLFSKIEEIFKGLQDHVKLEKERRVRSEEQMIGLLEEACGKYEAHLGNVRRR